jgi:c(7)-type cytochrome triheme protein
MKKTIVLAIVFAVAITFIGTSMAVPPGKTSEFKGGKMGKVVLDGKKHADAGNKCNDCHPKPFQMKKDIVKITQPDHKEDKFCFSCHNGEKAFKASTSCKKCHQKKKKVIKGC